MVNMWVYEEMIKGRKLTEIINTEHENVKYLPGHKLPKNVVSVQGFLLQLTWFCSLVLNYIYANKTWSHEELCCTAVLTWTRELW